MGKEIRGGRIAASRKLTQHDSRAAASGTSRRAPRGGRHDRPRLFLDSYAINDVTEIRGYTKKPSPDWALSGRISNEASSGSGPAALESV